jgi:hypothetical protein
MWSCSFFDKNELFPFLMRKSLYGLFRHKSRWPPKLSIYEHVEFHIIFMSLSHPFFDMVTSIIGNIVWKQSETTTLFMVFMWSYVVL